MDFFDDEIIDIEQCPWCREKTYEHMYISNTDVVKCKKCGIVYARQILNEKGRSRYWNKYCDNIHLADSELTEKRKNMYRIDFDFIDKFVGNIKEVLDIGCSKGEFLDIFEENGYQCFGIEYDQVAAEYASKKYKIWSGDLADIKIDRRFKLITIRGTIQYFLEPRRYFDKIVELLDDEGIIYISASPNAESLCFNLYKEKFSLPVCLTDYYAYNEHMLTSYFESKNISLICNYDFYEQTPYCNLESDILRVSEAIRDRENIKEKSPAFYNNMLTLVYKKGKK